MAGSEAATAGSAARLRHSRDRSVPEGLDFAAGFGLTGETHR
jgi:hypothetical protein